MAEENKEVELEAKSKYFELMENNLTNCSTADFMKNAYKLRELVERFESATKINEIRSENRPIKDGETEEEKATNEKNFVHQKWSKMLIACFSENYDLTIELLAEVYFTTPEEICKCEPFELNNLLLKVLSDARVNDFFTSLRLWGLIDTATP